MLLHSAEVRTPSKKSVQSLRIQTSNLGVVFRTGAVRRRAAPLAVQLAHARRVADDGALADAAVADD